MTAKTQREAKRKLETALTIKNGIIMNRISNG
jgi:hypothetical protein